MRVAVEEKFWELVGSSFVKNLTADLTGPKSFIKVLFYFFQKF
jgi:hypothetical protein